MRRGGRGVYAAGGIAVAFGVYLATLSGPAFLAPLLSSSAPVTRPSGTSVTTTRAGTATNFDENLTPSIASAAADTGRYHSTKGLLSEASAVNLALRSEALDNASWSTLGTVTRTADAVAAPDGTTTADLLAENATASANYAVFQAMSVSASTSYAFSVFMRQRDIRYVQLNCVGNVSGDHQRFFDLQTQTLSASTFALTDSYVTIASNSFARYTIVFTTGATDANVTCYIAPSTSDTLSTHVGVVGAGTYLWGSQFEAGVVSSSYIRTVAATVTRNADVHTVPTTGWPTTSGEVSFYFTPNAATWSTSPRLLSTRDGTTQGWEVYAEASGALTFYSAGVTRSTSSLLWTAGTPYKIRVRWDGVNVTIWRDATQVLAPIASAFPSAISATGRVGGFYVTGSEANGSIRDGCVGPVGSCR